MSRIRHTLGFSLIELGIVLAVIAILSSIVIYGAGYFRAAKQRMAVDLVLKIRQAATLHSQRYNRGLAYGVSLSQDDARNVTLKGLRGEGFLPVQVSTPWGESNNLVVSPHDATGICSGFTCLRIQMPVPEEECRDGDRSYLVLSLRDRAIPNGVTCSGKTFSVILR